MTYQSNSKTIFQRYFLKFFITRINMCLGIILRNKNWRLTWILHRHLFWITCMTWSIKYELKVVLLIKVMNLIFNVPATLFLICLEADCMIIKWKTPFFFSIKWLIISIVHMGYSQQSCLEVILWLLNSIISHACAIQ